MLPQLCLAVAIAWLALPATAHAMESCEPRDGVAVICSATWQFDGTCTGEDLWNSWKVGGIRPSPDAFVRPWHDRPIVIVGYELMKLRADTVTWWHWLKGKLRFVVDPSLQEDRRLNEMASWFSVGSTIQPDAMIWLAPGERHARQMWPAGHGQPWPSQADAKPIKPHKNDKGETTAIEGDLIDLHGACYGGGPVTILLTLYYVMRTEHAATVPAPAL